MARTRADFQHCVARRQFPNDTVQSKLPEPGWLERWLDEQIRFDKEWERKVSTRILHNLSLLFGESFKTVQDLNRYRKELMRGCQAQGSDLQPA